MLSNIIVSVFIISIIAFFIYIYRKNKENGLEQKHESRQQMINSFNKLKNLFEKKDLNFEPLYKYSDERFAFKISNSSFSEVYVFTLYKLTIEATYRCRLNRVLHHVLDKVDINDLKEYHVENIFDNRIRYQGFGMHYDLENYRLYELQVFKRLLNRKTVQNMQRKDGVLIKEIKNFIGQQELNEKVIEIFELDDKN